MKYLLLSFVFIIVTGCGNKGIESPVIPPASPTSTRENQLPRALMPPTQSPDTETKGSFITPTAPPPQEPVKPSSEPYTTSPTSPPPES